MITAGLGVIVLLAIAVCWLVFTLLKLKQKNKIISFQAKEIEKQLQEMNELVHQNKQIISVVSHDLKGPFNRIFALVHLMNLSVENFTPDQRNYLNKIHQIVADGLSMMRNLLDNRRLEDKGIDLVNEKLNFAAVIGSLVKNYQLLAEKKEIQIHFSSPAQVMLFSDKLHLIRVFENLLSNALKFTGENKNIFVNVVDELDRVEVSIRDEGPGIGEADQLKLYNKLQRLSARPTGGESSTGLGLWIVKTILDKMEASIRCESSGLGTTFLVTLKKGII